MSDIASLQRSGFLLRLIGPAAWIRACDSLAVLVVVALPWSTTLVAIFLVLFLIGLLPTFDVAAFLKTLARPASAFPVALFVLAVIGMFWAADIPWAARLRGINPAAKLLVIPFLIYHFERSRRGDWVVVAFLSSCVVLMLLSWMMFLDPRLVFDPTKTIGIPVKNYITQSQEFALCTFGAAGAAMLYLRAHRPIVSLVLALLAAGFLADMIFVASSRTVLVCIPVLLLVYVAKYYGWGGSLLVVSIALVFAIFAWNISPSLRLRINTVSTEYKLYEEKNAATSTGMRLEFWRKSIRFIESAPFFGHGTGATKILFERDAVGQTGVSAEVVGNPHNQTLNVAVQWGIFGCVVLYGMWCSHLFMFRGDGLAAWIGLAAVVENMTSSILNSHVFDFVEGWLYVMAVGVAAGMLGRRDGGSRSTISDRDTYSISASGVGS